MSASPSYTASMPRFVKFNNSVIGGLLRAGIPVGPNYLLTVPGRKSGIPRTTPVAVVEWKGQRYMQSTFGPHADWVKNLRVAGFATIRKGRHEEGIRAEELSPEQAAPVFQHFIPQIPKAMRKQLGMVVENDAPFEDFIELARQHPMFRIIPA